MIVLKLLHFSTLVGQSVNPESLHECDLFVLKPQEQRFLTCIWRGEAGGGRFAEFRHKEGIAGCPYDSIGPRRPDADHYLAIPWTAAVARELTDRGRTLESPA